MKTNSNRLIAAIIALAAFVNTKASAQSSPKHELRAVWLTTFVNIDWPSANNLSTNNQQAQLTTMLDQLQAAGINAVFFQVRSQCDAMYNSSIEPWSADLTGMQGRAPSPNYDPLEFLIAACRQRGIEVHAWFNPFRAVSNFNNIGSFSTNHVARTKPEWLLAQGNLRILDPGIPQVRDYVISVVMDLLRRYDVDGIHYDDYFYPYPPTSGSAFNDDATFAANARGFTNRQDWRRDNINLFIQRSHDSIRNVKPWVKFGVSPFGIWRNQGSDPAGSATNGLQSYSDVYADSRKWLQQSWVDYVIPQLYWSIGFSAANYSVLLPWWNALGGTRHIYSGIGAYKISNGGTDNNWNQVSQVPNQIRMNRQYSQVQGQSFFSTKSILNNPLGIRDSLSNSLFKSPALLPTMPWKDNQPPAPVSNLTAQVSGNEITLRWNAPPASDQQMDKVRQYVVYRSNTGSIDRNNAAQIVKITANENETSFTDAGLSTGTYVYTVTALDRLHNESTPANNVTAQILTTSVAPTAPVNTEQDALSCKIQPNPVSNTAMIYYELKQPMQLTILVSDEKGNEVMRLFDGKKLAGKYGQMLDGRNLPNGFYIVQFITQSFRKILKFTVAR